MTSGLRPVVTALKALANFAALLVVSPGAFLCWLEHRLNPGAFGVFWFWTHVAAVLPGYPGIYLRRAFYHLTLRHCSLDCLIGFGVLVAHRDAEIEQSTYIGPYAMIGLVRIKSGSLIGTRANLLSGGLQHELGADGRWTRGGLDRHQKIQIGPNAWIGEAAVVMADVGASSLVAAGSVVSSAVPERIVVAGNPARFVRAAVPATSAPAVVTESAPSEPGRKPEHLPFIDWLKVFGIAAIVYGHVAGWAPLVAVPPVYSKQFGVAFFVFVAGYALIRETRSRWRVVFNRLFEVYLFGFALALLLTAVGLVTNTGLQLSNYGPLAGGINVLFNNFPANPTTWYLGTYVHLMLAWALVSRWLRPTIFLLIAAVAVEIGTRAVLTQSAGGFVAYMALPNWMTVFLLGCWFGQKDRPRVATAAIGTVAVAALLIWLAGIWWLPFIRSFPLMRVADAGIGWSVAGSGLVSMAYLGMTWLAYQVANRLPALGLVQFLARNTLIVFLAHMPVVISLQPRLNAAVGREISSTVLFLICLPGLALLSEALRRVIDPQQLRDRLFSRVAHGRVFPAAAPLPQQKQL